MSARRATLAFGEQTISVDIAVDRDLTTVRLPDGRATTVTVQSLGSGAFAVTAGERRYVAHYVTDGTRHFLHVDGETYVFQREPADTGRRAASLQGDLRAPMPGLITQVLVREGQEVGAGEPLYIVEAMKMEHVVRTGRACRVKTVSAAPGVQVEAGTMVVEVEDLSEAS